MTCECKAPAVDAVININTGTSKPVCEPCGQRYIAIGGYKGPWNYLGASARELAGIALTTPAEQSARCQECGFQAFGFMPPCVLEPGHVEDHQDGFGGFYGLAAASLPPTVDTYQQTCGTCEEVLSACTCPVWAGADSFYDDDPASEATFALVAQDTVTKEARSIEPRKPAEPIKAKQVNLFEPELF